MEKLVATGKVKAIGVSNYSVRYLEELLPVAEIVPAVNQIENHPSLPQQEIVDFCNAKGILITAYSPLGSSGSPMMKEKAVLEVAERRGITPASVLLSYHSMESLSPKSSKIVVADMYTYSCERKLRSGKIRQPREDQVEHGAGEAE